MQVKNGRYIIAVDQSTSGTKSMVIDKDGSIISSENIVHKQFYPKPGWLEHDPVEIYENVVYVIKKAIDSASINPSDLCVLAITNQRETVLLWDRYTGKPVYNAIVWQCRRTSGICDKLKKEGHDKLIREKTGLLIDPYFSASKVKWIFENIKGVREKASSGQILMGTVDSWLIWNLTGGKVHATDYTNASRTLLFNIKELCWDEEILSIFGIPEKILPEVRYSDDVFGFTSDNRLPGYNIPISGIIGDSQGALFGQNCFEPGMLKTTLGTGSSVMMFTGNSFYNSLSGLVSSIAWGLEKKISYAIEGIIHSTGDTVNWSVDNLHIAKDFVELDKFAAEIVENDGVYLVPAFYGLGIPYWNPDARAAIIGLSRRSNYKNIARATIESVAYQVMDAVEQMFIETGIKPVELRADGGLTNSEIFMQFQADILDVSVVSSDIPELSLMGAAYIAGMQAGIWKNLDSIKAMRKIKKIYKPSMSLLKRNKYYKGWKEAVKRVL